MVRILKLKFRKKRIRFRKVERSRDVRRIIDSKIHAD